MTSISDRDFAVSSTRILPTRVEDSTGTDVLISRSRQLGSEFSLHACAYFDDLIFNSTKDPAANQRLQYFFESQIREQWLAAKTATMAMKTWRSIEEHVNKNVAVPSTGVGPDGELLYTWNRGKHHFEVEIYPDGHGEFFYLNRETDDVWELDYTIGDPIPDDVFNKLNLLVEND